MSLFVSVQEAAAVRVCRDLVRLRTQRSLQFVDLTALVAERVRRSGVREGMVSVQSRHTTAAVLVNENEPLLLQDFEDLLERWAPAAASYRHNDLEARLHAPANERRNGHAHARALLLGASVCLNVALGRLDLGEWQSVFLVELDGPRDRTLSIQVIGAPADHGDRRP
ncbi:MAG TPA: secondary thiamine-phosphate synthase enzyme YjbQ [Vicinamibacteria bacterium]